MAQPLLIPIIHSGVECYQVYEDWQFEVDGVSYNVPRGLVVDGASVPRLLWSFKSPDGLHRAASLAHDALYGQKGIMPGRVFTRKECDRVFLDLLRQYCVPCARLMYRGVRIGGWLPWSRPKNVVILPVRNAVAASQGHRNHLYSAPQ